MYKWESVKDLKRLSRRSDYVWISIVKVIMNDNSNNNH